MRSPSLRPVSRRHAVMRGLAAGSGFAASAGLVGVRSAASQLEEMTASGGGVNLKPMPSPDGAGVVPVRELFSFDAHYAQCVIEDNPAPFAMDTHEMGRVVIERHAFFMAMYAHQISLVSIRDAGDGSLVARLTGDLACVTEAGTATATIGSREADEPAFFEIEAVDGGHGGGAAGDRFAFIVYFDPEQAPVNHAIFGPNPTFTGELIAGEVTITTPAVLPLLPAATPEAATPTG